MTPEPPADPEAPGPASARPRAGFLRTITGRTVLLTAGVAVIAALVAIVVSVPLITGGARAEAQATVNRLADVTVQALQRPSTSGTPARLRDLLLSQNITPIVIGPGQPQAPGLTSTEAQEVIAGASLSRTTTIDGQDYFLAARPLNGTYALVLIAPDALASDPAATGVRRLLAALLAGVVVAVVIGYAASRRVTRPLREAALAAERLSAGERGLTVNPAGPAEVADIARSLNNLSHALATSEGRQRDFLLSVSHELRTPLTAIRGYAEAISDGMVPTAEVEATGGVMEREAKRLDRLVADLLDLARLGAADFVINPVDLDLTELATEAAQVWRSRCEREGVRFLAELPAGPLYVRSDPIRARQIIDNLAENALRVTPAGAPIVLAVVQDGADAVVTVRDGGPGLTAADMAVAFEPAALYSRFKGVRTVGSGVGLALVGRLAGRLGGAASVADAPEGGAAFSVRLPRLLPPGTPGAQWV